MFEFLFNIGSKKTHKKHHKKSHKKRKSKKISHKKNKGPFGPAPGAQGPPPPQQHKHPSHPQHSPFGPAPGPQGPPPPATPFGPPPPLPPPPAKSKTFSRKHKHHKSGKVKIHFGLKFGPLPQIYKQLPPPPIIEFKKYNPFYLVNYDYRINVDDKAKYNDGIEYMLQHLFYYYFRTYYKRAHYLKKDVFEFTIWGNNTFMDSRSEISTNRFTKVKYLIDLPNPAFINFHSSRKDMYYVLFFHYIPEKLNMELVVKFTYMNNEYTEKIPLETDTTVVLNHGCEYKLNVKKNNEIGTNNILMTRLIIIK